MRLFHVLCQPPACDRAPRLLARESSDPNGSRRRLRRLGCLLHPGLLICVCVVLSACQNTRDRERCLSYGFDDRTSDFSRCLQRFDIERDRRDYRSRDGEEYEE